MNYIIRYIKGFIGFNIFMYGTIFIIHFGYSFVCWDWTLHTEYFPPVVLRGFLLFSMVMAFCPIFGYGFDEDNKETEEEEEDDKEYLTEDEE